jgi:hypothetical protein
MRGFVPLESICPDRLFDLSSLSNGLVEGNVRITADGMLYCDVTLTGEIQPANLIVTDSNGTQLAVISSHEMGTYQSDTDFMLPSFVRRIHFLPQYADGTVGAELFYLQW